ncbi:MAG: plastocyanin/azurin family copper-binding protein [Vicinamibacterales bacterium]
MKRASLILLLAAAAVAPISIGAQGAATPAKPAAGAPAKPAGSTPAKPAASAAAGQGQTIEIGATDAMKFTVEKITAKPGEKIKVRLKGTGTTPKVAMAHNFVLLVLTANPTMFSNDAIMAGVAANYIPAAHKAQVLASTPLIGPGETAEVSFTAPTKPGTYTYLCSFPGHFAAGMKGTLVVK